MKTPGKFYTLRPGPPAGLLSSMLVFDCVSEASWVKKVRGAEGRKLQVADRQL